MTLHSLRHSFAGIAELKGGTAINLFIRDLPRLSVDIDLTHLPVEDRGTSPAAIDVAMLRIAERITEMRRSRAPARSTSGLARAGYAGRN